MGLLVCFTFNRGRLAEEEFHHKYILAQLFAFLECSIVLSSTDTFTTKLLLKLSSGSHLHPGAREHVTHMSASIRSFGPCMTIPQCHWLSGGAGGDEYPEVSVFLFLFRSRRLGTPLTL